MSRAAPVAVVAGGLARRPGVGGHAWVFLNWLLGLESLGFEVLFLDRLDDRPHAVPDDPDPRTAERAWIRRVMVESGFEGKFALVGDGGQAAGPCPGDLVERCRRADVLFNVMGYLDDDVLLASIPGPKVFVDIDPGFPQMWHALGLCDLLDCHDAFVTVGLGVGEPPSDVPTCGRRWINMLPPVALEAWPRWAAASAGRNPRMTTVASWRGPDGPIEYDGVTYGLRVHEHRVYAELPKRVPGVSFEIALDIDPADGCDADLLRRGGWTLSDPSRAAGTPRRYREFLRGSDAEFVVAKGMYVRSRGGWFSDRSACYLATGRPVIAQDTGFSTRVPTGQGLLSFSDVDGAVAAVEEVTGALGRHQHAARELAAEYFDARKVLTSVLDAVGAA